LKLYLTIILTALFLSTLFLSGCSMLNVKTTITDPNGLVWAVSSKSDALVQIKKTDTEITIDNRGRMSAFEAIMGTVMTNTDVNLGLSNKAQEINE